MEYVLIGKILNTHGVKGELKVDTYSDFISERFKKDSLIYIGEEKKEVSVKSYRMHNNFMLLLLNDLEDINLVEKYKSQLIYKADKDIKPLEDGYYFKDLRDLDVYADNKLIGKTIKMEEGFANNNLRIKVNDKEVLIPFVKAFILNVDLDNKRIDINLMEGLL